MPNMEKATEVFILVIALLPVVARLLLAGISPQAARISEDRRAVVRVPCRLCGDCDCGGALFAVGAADSSRHCTAGDRAGSVAGQAVVRTRPRAAAGVAGDRADQAVGRSSGLPEARGPLRPGLQDEQFSPANGLRRRAQERGGLAAKPRWRSLGPAAAV